MKTTVFMSVGGDKPLLESLAKRLGLKCKIVKYPARHRMNFSLEKGSAEHAIAEDFVKKHDLALFTREEIRATHEEVKAAEYLSLERCSWIEDDDTTFEPPPYSLRDACRHCGKGALELTGSLVGDTKRFRGSHLIRIPPGLVLGSMKLAELITSWSGPELAPVIDRKTGRESEHVRQLRITSILPPMHVDARIERSVIPEHCDICRRLGYQMSSRQAYYSRKDLAHAADWNLSREWVAPHFVSCPQLICSQRVVVELLRLEKRYVWIPVVILD